MKGRLAWNRDGHDWPYREASRFIDTPELTWHVQVIGAGPAVLLIHGTGASTHSWRRLVPLISRSFTVVMPDLPGHGFSGMPASDVLSLPGMAKALAGLMRALRIAPVVIAGHSAGAAIAIRACIDQLLKPQTIVSINGALLPFGSVVGQFFSPLAKFLVAAPFVPQLMAWRAQSRQAVERAIEGTGSHLRPEDIDYYARLFANPGHVAGALGMMANWDLQPLERDLPKLSQKLILVTASNDRAISPQVASRVQRLVPRASLVNFEGAGHLLHEELPAAVAKVILTAANANLEPPVEWCRKSLI